MPKTLRVKVEVGCSKWPQEQFYYSIQGIVQLNKDLIQITWSCKQIRKSCVLVTKAIAMTFSRSKNNTWLSTKQKKTQIYIDNLDIHFAYTNIARCA